MSETTLISVDDLEDPEEGAVWRKVPRSRVLRRWMKLTVEEFAERYGLPADVLRAWEDGTAQPDAVAEAFLLAIAREPDVIAKALAPREPRGNATRAKTAAE
jgi:hypothetical protein